MPPLSHQELPPGQISAEESRLRHEIAQFQQSAVALMSVIPRKETHKRFFKGKETEKAYYQTENQEGTDSYTCAWLEKLSDDFIDLYTAPACKVNDDYVLAGEPKHRVRGSRSRVGFTSTTNYYTQTTETQRNMCASLVDTLWLIAEASGVKAPAQEPTTEG